MPKLEFELWYRDKKYGTTSIMIDEKPQFSLSYFSPRPNKVPLPMNTSLMTSEGGLEYIGPLQPEAGFLSDNEYVVEVKVTGTQPGVVVGLSTLEIKNWAGQEPGPLDYCTITPVDGGKTNNAGIAEFKVNFGRYPADWRKFFWLGFNWVITTEWGKYVDPTPHALMHGGEKLTAGLNRRLNPEVVADQVINIHPGQYGFWVDVQIGGGGGGMFSYNIRVDHGGSSPGYDGGSMTLYMGDPVIRPYIRPWNVDGDAVWPIPIAFAEGGQGGIGNGKQSAHGCAAVFTKCNLVANDSRRANVTVEKIHSRNGMIPKDTFDKHNLGDYYYFGKYADKVRDSLTNAGQGFRYILLRGSGAAANAIVRIHFRKVASAANLPLRPLSLRMFAENTIAGKYYEPIKSTHSYTGSAEVKAPHSKVNIGGSPVALTNTSQLPHLKSSVAAGIGGVGYDGGGQNGGPGTVGIIDFGYYTSFA